MLESYGIKPVGGRGEASLIVLNGGALMTAFYKRGFEILRWYNRDYADTLLAFIPATFGFEPDSFSELFQGRRAPVYFYAREQPSLDLLRSVKFPCPAQFGIDHDMAFHLQGTRYIEGLISSQRNRHVLIVERADPEGTTGLRTAAIGPSFFKRYLPKAIKTRIKHAVWERRARDQTKLTEFARTALRGALADNPGWESLPVFSADISAQEVCTFKRFSQLIADAAVVITTRMHVGILAAMLGKPVYINRGSHHKIRGVYEHSLKDLKHVQLI